MEGDLGPIFAIGYANMDDASFKVGNEVAIT